VKPNDVTLVTINQIKPIQVEFSVPQQNLPELIKRMGEGKLDVQAVIKGQEATPESGELSFIDNAIDTSTGTVRLKATFSNAEQRLWPGQFVSLTLVLTVQHAAVVVPTCVVQTGQKGTYAFVLKPNMTVESRPVTVARIYGDDSVISDGLKPGESVVADGQMRLSLGAAVEIKPAGEPKAQR
jgi:multidrug efflux system membrane fusion protein